MIVADTSVSWGRRRPLTLSRWPQARVVICAGEALWPLGETEGERLRASPQRWSSVSAMDERRRHGRRRERTIVAGPDQGPWRPLGRIRIALVATVDLGHSHVKLRIDSQFRLPKGVSWSGSHGCGGGPWGRECQRLLHTPAISFTDCWRRVYTVGAAV